jgi:hypothetical protein
MQAIVLIVASLLRGESGSFATPIQDDFASDATLSILPESVTKLDGFLFEVLFMIIALAKTFSSTPCLGDFLRAMNCLGLCFLNMVLIEENKTCEEFLALLVKEILGHIRTKISERISTSPFNHPYIIMVNHVCFVIKQEFKVIYIYNSKFNNFSYLGPFVIDAPATGDCLPFSLIIAYNVSSNISQILAPREDFQVDLNIFNRSESYASMYQGMLAVRRNCHRTFRDLDAPFVHAQTVTYTVGGTKETRNGLTLTVGGETVTRTMTNCDVLYSNSDLVVNPRGKPEDIDFSPSNLDRRIAVAKRELDIFLTVGPTPDLYPGHSMMYGFLYALKIRMALAVMHVQSGGFVRSEEIVRAGAPAIVASDKDPLCQTPLFHRPTKTAEGNKLGITLDTSGETWISGQPAVVSNHMAIYHMGAHYQVPVPAWVFFLLIKHDFYVGGFKPMFNARVSLYLCFYLFTPLSLPLFTLLPFQVLFPSLFFLAPSHFFHLSLPRVLLPPFPLILVLPLPTHFALFPLVVSAPLKPPH